MPSAGGVIRQALAGKDHAVAREPPIDGPHGAVAAAVPQIRDDIRTGILVEGLFQLGLLATAVREAEQATHLGETPDGDDTGQGTRQRIEALVNDHGIEFVGELARGAIVLVVGDGPLHIEGPLGVSLGDVNGDPATLGQGMDREAGQHGLGAQDAQGRTGRSAQRPAEWVSVVMGP